jgi:hypothetical protein
MAMSRLVTIGMPRAKRIDHWLPMHFQPPERAGIGYLRRCDFISAVSALRVGHISRLRRSILIPRCRSAMFSTKPIGGDGHN